MPEQRHSSNSGVVIVNFEHFFTLFSNVSVVDFEQVFGWLYILNFLFIFAEISLKLLIT